MEPAFFHFQMLIYVEKVPYLSPQIYFLHFQYCFVFKNFNLTEYLKLMITLIELYSMKLSQSFRIFVFFLYYQCCAFLKIYSIELVG